MFNNSHRIYYSKLIKDRQKMLLNDKARKEYQRLTLIKVEWSKDSRGNSNSLL